MTTTVTTPSRTIDARGAALAGAAAAAVGAGWSFYGAHSWAEIGVVCGALAVTTALVFGYVVPRALRKESAGGTALGLSVPAVLLMLPAFWSGLPLVLGVAGMIVGGAGRQAPKGAGACIAAVALGALASAAYLAVFVYDGLVLGHRGFLLD